MSVRTIGIDTTGKDEPSASRSQGREEALPSPPPTVLYLESAAPPNPLDTPTPQRTVEEKFCQESSDQHRSDYKRYLSRVPRIWYSVLVLRVLFASFRNFGHVTSKSQVFSRVF
jgi:hypothetical protein